MISRSFRTFAAALSAVLLALVVPACGSSGDCDDGVDNDGDGRIDGTDRACASGADSETADPPVYACDDGVDNDEDGLTDAEDPGCSNPDDDDEQNQPISACNDGVDNDGDGLIDYPNEPGCTLSLDDDEDDECPDGTSCAECSNGVDDDGDGQVDYPADTGCDSAGDPNEFSAADSDCAGAPVLQLPPDGLATGILDGDDASTLVGGPGCGGAGSERVYQFTIDAPRSATFTTVSGNTTMDTVLYLRSDCTDVATEYGCNDDAAADTFASTLVVESLEPGTYHLVVDSRSAGVGGAYRLQATLLAPLHGTCDPGLMECPPGLLCQEATATATETTCEPPRCSDGLDFDGDGQDGYPEDPGCESPTDNDETDDCPSGPDCPQCSNGADDDGDGDTDYPADADCGSANGAAEEIVCTGEDDTIVTVTAPITNANLFGATDDFDGSCQSNTNLDRAFRLEVPGDLTTLHITTDGSTLSDTVLYLKPGGCGADIECNDDGGLGLQSLINRPNVPAGVYFIIVDAFGTTAPTMASGAVKLTVTGTIATGQSCKPGQATNGLFPCQGGGACTGGVCQAP